MNWRYHPDLLARPVPRYTSFPTAAEFGDGMKPADMAEALAGVRDDEEVSLYLHVPYCRELCWYCGCNTGAANRDARLAAYVTRLGQEIDRVARALDGRGRLSRIAWGGGSPDALAPEQFDALMARLADAFPRTGASISIELDPRGFDAHWAERVARHGIRRVSLGVQTFDDGIQRAIGRVQPTAAIACAVSRLRASGVSSLNFDLMYGLPGQSSRELRETLDTAVSLGPDRLAVFGYAHVPHLIPRQRQIDASELPGAAQRFAQAELAHGRLTADGYQPVGFDHFARPDDPLGQASRTGGLRRNFQGFTDDSARVLIGLGASSISVFPHVLLQNEKNAGRYHLRIANDGFATSRGIRRSPLDQRRAAAIESLLCTGSANLEGMPDLSDIRDALQPFVDRDLAEWRAAVLTTSGQASPYLRSMAATIDPYRSGGTSRFSSAV
ncbi:oxygen-independent coproporphyrinogen III oxidase [Sphingomonas floccifaciens]|uniref:Coproporphyrinogen-III oxidase n=1 Tax=Sphingomonas floccifaciens TaxID=1844115 RepID=A0ABW4NBM2_9SPHN